MTRAYRRRRYQTDREYDEGLSWDEEYSPRGYTGGNVDWGGGDAEAEYSVDDHKSGGRALETGYFSARSWHGPSSSNRRRLYTPLCVAAAT